MADGMLDWSTDWGYIYNYFNPNLVFDFFLTFVYAILS